MTTTAVGMRCPECARKRTKVKTMRNLTHQGWMATQALIAINVAVFLAEGTSVFTFASSPTGPSYVFDHGFLMATYVGSLHQYYRLLTAGFIHIDLLHIGSNMLVLYFVGRMLEPAIGRLRFVSIYFVGLFAGSLGALLLSPNDPTVGASGAIFAIMGAAFVELRARGVNPWEAGIGGLIGGGLAALAWQYADRQRRPLLLGIAGCLVLVAIVIAASIIFSSTYTFPPYFPHYSI